ncbi:MAG: hypothetical protein ACR2L3_00340 [Actinomycetota bacterium]
MQRSEWGVAKKSEKVELLRNVPMFQGCSDRQLSNIVASTKEVHFEAGREICHEGESGVGLHVVIEGETKVQIGGRTK